MRMVRPPADVYHCSHANGGRFPAMPWATGYDARFATAFAPPGRACGNTCQTLSRNLQTTGEVSPLRHAMQMSSVASGSDSGTTATVWVAVNGMPMHR